ncbi:CdaR family transcriptional regulator [Rhodococcus wratislaviensis IFP 2016]|nr:CdaR family transcriptional regulator [Rhodococcus wratislaviensis IFP 2016]
MLPMTAAMGLLTCAGREIHSKWPLARTALRLAVDPATLGPTHVDYDELGSVAILVDAVDAKAAADSADVRMVFDMSVRRPWVVPTLNAIQRRASAREVARELNLHHSTVQQRIDWLERHLGYTLSSSVGYARMTTTLILWRLVAADARSSSGAETIGGQTET